MAVSSVLLPQSSHAEGSLLEQLLGEQQSFTAVEVFSRHHQADTVPAQARHYRDLIPLSAPAAGEQYAFEVDLDACSGCKACVVACHNLNGLDEDEIWRSVGQLTGGSSQAAVVQHVTAACHHCVEPACLHGCPVNAYEKDPLTGIVRHLDDQCIGCQYCILKCPYDVPKYNAKRGIVRKCDMCHQRLAVGEAPACVQACPNGAIRITVINKQTVIEESESDLFLPGAAAPSYTLPTTVYRSSRPLPRNLLPADYHSAAPQHAHWPLVVMLVLTQMSVGAFAVEQILAWLDPSNIGSDQPVRLLAAFVLGVAGLVGSLFHLGRPWLAYRAIIGLRTSWLSREILCFGLFAALASMFAVRPWLPLALDSAVSAKVLGLCVIASGVAGIWCSVMVYHSTQRPYWHWAPSALRFFASGLVLGIPCSLLVSLVAARWSHEVSVLEIMLRYGSALCGLLALIAIAKLAFEASVFMHLLDRNLTPLKRTASLLTGELARTAGLRFACGLVGGALIPILVVTSLRGQAGSGMSTGLMVCALVAALVLSIVGELLERYLFFTAVIAPKMPGSPAP